MKQLSFRSMVVEKTKAVVVGSTRVMLSGTVLRVQLLPLIVRKRRSRTPRFHPRATRSSPVPSSRVQVRRRPSRMVARSRLGKPKKILDISYYSVFQLMNFNSFCNLINRKYFLIAHFVVGFSLNITVFLSMQLLKVIQKYFINRRIQYSKIYIALK